MITNKNKIKLVFITLILDFFLIYIYLNRELVEIDKLFIECILFIHTLFFIALYKSYYKLIDILHIFVFPSFFCFFIIKNFELKLLLLFLLSLIQILWIWEGTCIMNTKKVIFSNLFNKCFHSVVFIYYSICCIFLRE